MNPDLEDEAAGDHYTIAELHSMNAYNAGPLECGCNAYYLDVMGCDHTCEIIDPPEDRKDREAREKEDEERNGKRNTDTCPF